jgi:predicted Ser/Thr protein kinase
VRLLIRGGPTKANLLLVPAGEESVVVKDFAAKNLLVRLLGRLQIRREAAAYRLLQGVEGVPAFIGRVDAHALAVEYVDGKPLKQCRRRPQRREYLRRLSRTMEAMHARGVIHNDLRGQDNILVAHGTDRVVLLDLGGSARLEPGTWRHRLFAPLWLKVDRAALLKWKQILVPEEVTGEEREFLRRFRRWRRLWPFNPKRERLHRGGA